jgi:hypothetical protein
MWRAGVGALIVGVLGVQIAWLVGRAADMPLAVSFAVGAIDLMLMAGASRALRMPPVDLRWDTQRWHIGIAPGNLTIALDLGGWMLLRFDPDSPLPGGSRTTWLPVQRPGLEPHWHALRCAVYCARPALGTDSGPNSAPGPESQE